MMIFGRATCWMEDIPRSSSRSPPLSEPHQILSSGSLSCPEHHFDPTFEITKRCDMGRLCLLVGLDENWDLLAGFPRLAVLERWFRQVKVRTKVAAGSFLLSRISCFHLHRTCSSSPFDWLRLSLTCSVVVASHMAVPFPVSLPPPIIALPSFGSL